MTTPPPKRAAKAGGFLLAIAIMIGTIAGVLLGQPSIGFLAGAATGIALTAMIWISDRRA